MERTAFSPRPPKPGHAPRLQRGAADRWRSSNLWKRWLDWVSAPLFGPLASFGEPSDPFSEPSDPFGGVVRRGFAAHCGFGSPLPPPPPWGPFFLALRGEARPREMRCCRREMTCFAMVDHSRCHA